MHESSPKVRRIHPAPESTVDPGVAGEVVRALAELLGGLPDVVHRVRPEPPRPVGTRPADRPDSATERCA
jgi:hypothetical protein